MKMLSITYHDENSYTVEYQSVEDFISQHDQPNYALQDDFVVDEAVLDGKIMDFYGGTLGEFYKYCHPGFVIVYRDADGNSESLRFADANAFLDRYIEKNFPIDDDFMIDDVLVDDSPVNFVGTLSELYAQYAPLIINYREGDELRRLGYYDIDDFLEDYASETFILPDDTTVDDVYLDGEPVVFSGTVGNLYQFFNQ